VSLPTVRGRIRLDPHNGALVAHFRDGVEITTPGGQGLLETEMDAVQTPPMFDRYGNLKRFTRYGRRRASRSRARGQGIPRRKRRAAAAWVIAIGFTSSQAG
jgi:hypothetical protein